MYKLQRSTSSVRVCPQQGWCRPLSILPLLLSSVPAVDLRVLRRGLLRVGERCVALWGVALRCVALSCVALRVSVTLYFMSICLLIIQVSSTFYFSPTAPTCCAWTCIAVAPCVTCDEDGVALPKTASVWRLRRSEETQVTHRTVTLDVRYCRDHFPVDPHSDISFVFLFFFFFFFSSSLLFSPLYFLLFAYVFRYGRFFATGYM